MMTTKERSETTARPFHLVRALLILFISSALMFSCDDDDDDDEIRVRENVVELAKGNDNLSSLESALLRFPDLVTTLSGNGDFTVFAPTNEAFNDLLDAVGQSSLDDIPDDVLRDVLEYHVVSGSRLTSGMLTSGEVESAGGESIEVMTGDGVTLNGSARVATADVSATNGVVHVVDAVLIPPSIAPVVGTVVAPAYFNKNFTTLIAAVKAASPAILQALLNSDAKTLFAPTNEAFEAAGITSLPETAVLDAVLSYHVIGMEVMSGDIADGSSGAPTLNGADIYLSKTSAGVFINGNSQVTTADIDASNGVVHVIDRTLMPPSKTIADIAVEYASSGTPEFTQLVAALLRTQGQGSNDLLAAAGAEGDLTVFAPTDAAFMELYAALGVSGVDEIPLETLIAVLKHHIVPARVFSTDLMSGPVATLNGNVTVDLADSPTVTGSSDPANEAAIQASLMDIHATNGVIHVIDKVLLP